MVTNGIEKSVIPPDWENFLEDKCQQKTAAGSKNQVMSLEEESKLEGCVVFHDVADGEDSREVHGDGREDDGSTGERGNTLHILSEIVGERIWDGGSDKVRESHGRNVEANVFEVFALC